MLVLISIQTSLQSYKENIIYFYTITGLFTLFIIWVPYIFIRRMEQYQETTKIYDKTLEINPHDSEVWNNKGTALTEMGEYLEAIKCFDRSIEIDPNNAAAGHNKGVGLEKRGKHQKAIKYYDKALELDPKFETTKKTGQIILKN